MLAHTQFSGRYLKYLYGLTFLVSEGRRSVNRACVGPRSTLRSTSSATGFVLFPPLVVFTNLSSTMLLMMVLRRMRIRFEGVLE